MVCPITGPHPCRTFAEFLHDLVVRNGLVDHRYCPVQKVESGRFYAWQNRRGAISQEMSDFGIDKQPFGRNGLGVVTCGKCAESFYSTS